MCIMGMQQPPCSPGTPGAELCDGLDNNCNGTPDDGAATSCPSAPFAMTYACMGAMCSFTCVPNRYDLDGVYGTGCECADDTSGGACAVPTALGSVNNGNVVTASGRIVPTGELDWYTVNFPDSGRGPGNGNPQIRLTGTGASNFRLDLYTSCGGAAPCSSGTPTGVGSYGFIDDQSPPGAGAYSSNFTAWPTTIIFSVRRATPTTDCDETEYTVTVSR
jgi:hypothetical protein